MTQEGTGTKMEGRTRQFKQEVTETRVQQPIIYYRK